MTLKNYVGKKNLYFWGAHENGIEGLANGKIMNTLLEEGKNNPI